MPIHQKVCFIAALERACQFPAVERELRGRNPVRDPEQTVDYLRASVENLQRTVCELLLKNQMLRMALERERESVATSPVTRFPGSQS
jgi:hypothetical protein